MTFSFRSFSNDGYCVGGGSVISLAVHLFENDEMHLLTSTNIRHVCELWPLILIQEVLHSIMQAGRHYRKLGKMELKRKNRCASASLHTKATGFSNFVKCLKNRFFAYDRWK